MSILYHHVLPENNAPNGFVENNQISFLLNGEGRKLEKNSIRLDFELEAYQNFSTIGAATNVRVQLGNDGVNDSSKIGINNKIGLHSVIADIATSTQSAGLLESLVDYPRMVNVLASGQMSEESYYDQRAQAEGRNSTKDAGRYVLQMVAPNAVLRAGAAQANVQGDAYAPFGQTTDTSTNPETAPAGYDITPGGSGNKCSNPTFSLKVLNCFNRCSGDGYSFAKNGYIRMEITLQRTIQAFEGVDNNGNCGYVIKNPRLRYITTPDDGKQGPIMMNTAITLKESVNSQQANINARVPLQRCSGVVMSYINQAREVDAVADSTALEQFPQLDRIEYLFQDNNMNYQTYPVEDKDSMIKLGVSALMENGLHQCDFNRIKANDGVIHGLNFQQFLDLTRQKFSVQLNSSATNLGASPVNVHLMFLGLLQM